jgi:signal transduction histidine kinase
VGILEVCFLEKEPEKDEGPFLKEERELINTISERLGETIERKQAEAALEKAHDELEQRVEERTREIEGRRQVAESLRDILTILNSNRPLGEILDYIVAQASWLLAADASAIYHLQDKDGLLNIQAARGLDPDYAVGMTIPAGQGITGQAVLARQPVATSNTSLYFADLMDKDEATLESHQQTFLKYLADRYGAMLAVPLIVKGKVYGTISLYFHQPREFSDEETALAAAFADQAALAIENSSLRTQVEAVAVAAERHRLARDLHDAVTQTLFSTSLIAEMLPRVWERYPDEARNNLEELRRLTRGALAEMRALLLELRPAALTEAKLERLLGHLTEAINSRTRVPISLTVEGDCVLPPDVQVALYRISQEALNNVAKHAKASQANVTLCCQPEQVELSVSDDGCGFAPDSISPDHLGVGIMYERAKAIGAMLKIESQPGSGTQVVVTWQVGENNKEDE